MTYFQSPLEDALQKVKKASYQISLLSDQKRNDVLRSLSTSLIQNMHKILDENEKDLALMPKDNPQYDRLLLNEKRVQGIASDLLKVANLPSPLEHTLLQKKLPNGISLEKRTVPLGVISVIYESRPNVTIDVFSLCFKSGNACVLKGGKEAHHSNLVFLEIIQEILSLHSVTSDSIYLMPADREVVHDLLNAVGLVDVCIPRGSQGLIDFVRSHAKIPVIETGAGIIHTYFDVSGDKEKGRAIIENAKTRRVSVCSALDTLVIHEKRLSDLPFLIEPLALHNVEIFADSDAYQALRGHYPNALLKEACEEDFGKEFLSYKMSIKTVQDHIQAVSHIMKYTSFHSEAIIGGDSQTIDYFTKNIDAAVVYVNVSTAFTDGGEFGMGAEVGISTQKLHARGPMGLADLTSYKWIACGDGHIRPI